MLVSLVTQRSHWTIMVRQRIIVRPLCGRMGRQQSALRSWALNVTNELPDGVNCYWATSVVGSPSPGPTLWFSEVRCLVRAG